MTFPSFCFYSKLFNTTPYSLFNVRLEKSVYGREFSLSTEPRVLWIVCALRKHAVMTWCSSRNCVDLARMCLVWVNQFGTNYVCCVFNIFVPGVKLRLYSETVKDSWSSEQHFAVVLFNCCTSWICERNLQVWLFESAVVFRGTARLLFSKMIMGVLRSMFNLRNLVGGCIFECYCADTKHIIENWRRRNAPDAQTTNFARLCYNNTI